MQRLEEAAEELEARAVALTSELADNRRRVEELGAAITRSEAQLDDDILALDALRVAVHDADDKVSALRIRTDGQEVVIKSARGVLESIRAVVAELDIARATAESDLSHLAASCVDTVQATLDDVIVEVDELERDGNITPDARVICAEEPDEEQDEPAAAGPRVVGPGGGAARPERGRRHHRAAGEDRSPRTGEHDGHRAVR